jgi:hypothetical protein
MIALLADEGRTMHFLLFYEKAPDHKARETPLSAAHRTHLDAAVRRGELILGGSLREPDDGGAVLLFEAQSPTVAQEFAKTDPYVVEGIVNRWSVRPWDTVVGTGLAARPSQ